MGEAHDVNAPEVVREHSGMAPRAKVVFFDAQRGPAGRLDFPDDLEVLHPALPPLRPATVLPRLQNSV